MQADNPVSRNTSRVWNYKKLGICVLQSISNNINKSLHTSRAHPSRSSGSTIQTQNYKCKVSKSNRNRDDAMKTRWFVWPKFGFTPCTHVWILLSVEEARSDPKVKLSPLLHYMTMRPLGTRSKPQQTCRCSPQPWELAGDA